MDQPAVGVTIDNRRHFKPVSWLGWEVRVPVTGFVLYLYEIEPLTHRKHHRIS